ncbi:UNVERIFIED_ORG: collagenase-like PrtC family protease [Bacillus cereus]
MNLSVSTNFDNRLIDGVKDLKVTNVFGKLTNDFVGGGLETDFLDAIDKSKVENHVKYAHDHGITVNYTFNNPFLSNDEFTLNGKKELRKLLDWISDIGIDSLTVSIPILVRFIKDNYPNLGVKVSSTVCVNSVAKVKQWVEMGADCIVLDPMTTNRNFPLLKEIRKATNIDLELIVNNNCLYECPMLPYHQAFLGQSSRISGKKVTMDYCYLGCSSKRVFEPANYLISDIIRPEDLHLYTEMGYDHFKIIDRATPTEVAIKRCKAYSEEKFDGNLLEIIQHYGYKDVMSPEEFLNNIYIDNSKLTKFMNWFVMDKCNKLYCGKECRYCYSYAEKAITTSNEFRDKYKIMVESEKEKIENF